MPQIFLFLLSIKKDSGRNNGTPAHISVPLIRVLKVIYSNICGKASKVHLADKDAIADRNVVPGARPQLCIPVSLSFTHRYTDSFSPHHLHSLPLSLLFPHLPSNTFSIVFIPVFFLSSHLQLPPSPCFSLSLLPPTHLLPCFPFANSHSTPSFLRHPDFMVI